MSKVHQSEPKTKEYLARFMEGVEKRNPGEPEFHQAVYEFAAAIFPFISDKPHYHTMQILERMVEPDRVIYFRVPWTDDEGHIRNNRGARVQFNGAIGPYKGGIRFHPSVNLSILKFLGFEQTFKNSLTGLPMGGGKGGAYFMEFMLNERDDSIAGKRCLVSGSGNVATHCAEKIVELGGTPLTLSDSSGFIHDPDGLDQEKINWVRELKEIRRGRISEYADQFKSATFHAGERPWGVAADLAFPCATQNEVNEAEAKTLITNGLVALAEGANMPCEQPAVDAIIHAKRLFGPAKAANAGGVGVSGLEMSQNSARIAWDEETLHNHLKDMMHRIHDSCAHYGRDGDYVDYLRGANIAGFVKVADAMLVYGHI